MNALAHGADSLYTPVRQPGLRDGGAARGGADRDRARPATRRARPAPRWRSARCSAATRSTPPCSASTTSSARPWSGSAAARTPRPTRRSCRARSASWPPGPRTDSPTSPPRSGPTSRASRPASSQLGGDPAGPRCRSAPIAPSSTRRSSAMLAAPELGLRPRPAARPGASSRSWSSAPGNRRPGSRVALCVNAERLARYHAYTRKHSVNSALYLLARIFMTPFFLVYFRYARTGREHARRQGRPDRRRQPPQLPRPLRDRRLPALAAADELRRQGRAVRAPLAGLGPLPARRLPDPPRRVRRGIDGDRAPDRRTRRRGLHLPRGHADPARHPRRTRGAASAASPCRPGRR